jgi:NAD+ kinase
MHSIGLVLHPQRDSAEAVDAVLGWASRSGVAVYGINDELARLRCAAIGVTPAQLGARCELIVSLGGDGTMLRAMRLADGAARAGGQPGADGAGRASGAAIAAGAGSEPTPVLGVNLGKLGFLAEIDVPDLPDALAAIEKHEFTVEPRLAVDCSWRGGRELGGATVTAFNDIATVRTPGDGGANIAVRVNGESFVSYAADAVIVATPTGSTAYSFSAGGPIVSPTVDALIVTPAAPHSAYNRGVVLSVQDSVSLHVLPDSGRLAVEVDGPVAGHIAAGDRLEISARLGAARVIRLGMTTFYQRARRKLRITDSAEITVGPAD